MSEITLLEAVNLALKSEMARDQGVIVMGEDVAVNGGVFRATEGLIDQFGPSRVLDTPLAESMIAGVATGMACQGLRPVAEFQFSGFIYAAMEQLISHTSRMRNRTRGRLSCPLVFRAPYGGGIRAPEHHSESMEAMFAHIPGVRVVIPSTPAKAYGLLLAAIRDPDPVIFLEPKRMYRLVKQSVADHGQALPLDRTFSIREGNDVTLVSWGAMLRETTLAADELNQRGIGADILDVATLKPIDMDPILRSIEKTNRCVIVHEAARHGGLGAEISATIAEKALYSLAAPIMRVTGYDTVMPYFQLEQYYLPTVNKIVSTVEQLMETA